MKPVSVPHRSSGFSLDRYLPAITTLMLAGLILLPHLSRMSDDHRVENRRNAENIVHIYLTGLSAGVAWPEGNVARKVDAVVTGMLPARGIFANRLFRATIPEKRIAEVYRHIGLHPNGLLFFDAQAAQPVDGL